MIYAQAEDDLNRIETNDLNPLGRLATAGGEAAIFRGLRLRTFIDPAELAGHTRRPYHSGPQAKSRPKVRPCQ
jgi:acyl-homoserine lactone acylase PvdQ